MYFFISFYDYLKKDPTLTKSVGSDQTVVFSAYFT